MVKKSVRKSVQNNENTKKQLKNQEKAWNSETEKGLNEIDIEMLNAHNILRFVFGYDKMISKYYAKYRNRGSFCNVSAKTEISKFAFDDY